MAMEKFPDLHQGLEFEDCEMIRSLLFLAHLQQEEGMRARKNFHQSISRRKNGRAPKLPLSFLPTRRPSTKTWVTFCWLRLNGLA